MTADHGPTPDFLVLGGHSCGSTWTQKCLMAHPDIFVPRRRRGVAFDRDQLAHFNDEPVTGIVNSTLLTDPDAPGAIEASSGGVRLVAILRNPIDRAYSWYLKCARDGDGVYSDGISFDDALEADPALIEGGLYHQGLEQYLEHFDRQQMLILDFDRLESDSEGFIKEIYGFVGADPSFKPPRLEARSNYSTSVKSGALHQLMRRGKRILWKMSGENGPLMSRIESSVIVGRLRRLNEKDPTTMSPEQRKRLAVVFEAPNEHLARLLDWDVSHWT